jgi:hypothetical protein
VQTVTRLGDESRHLHNFLQLPPLRARQNLLTAVNPHVGKSP